MLKRFIFAKKNVKEDMIDCWFVVHKFEEKLG